MNAKMILAEDIQHDGDLDSVVLFLVKQVFCSQLDTLVNIVGIKDEDDKTKVYTVSVKHLTKKVILRDVTCNKIGQAEMF
jgi:hypothetical protein